MKEITWFGRGGQGAFTASRILGAAAMTKGYKSIAFPSFGPERRGAPIRAFTKISVGPVTDRSVIEKSDYIIVLDDTLYDEKMPKLLKEGGRILINTLKPASFFKDERVLAKDISTIAVKHLKRPIVNIAILGLLIDLDKDIDLESVISAVNGYMSPKIAEKNIDLLNEVIESLNNQTTEF